MGTLSDRKEQILRAVVVEYVTTADPVASELIARRYELGVRSATVRSEMAEITELGLLEQPHTSAGRIPSDLGYRYFVDRLAVPAEPGQETQRRVIEAAKDEDTLKDLLQETTKLLSRLTRLLSAAVTLRNAAVGVRHAVVTALGPERALLVLVLRNGMVENRILECPPGTTLEHLGQANAALSQATDGVSLQALTKLKAPSAAGPVVGALVKSAFSALRTLARDLTQGRLITDGEEYVLAEPEFQRDADAMRTLLASIEDESALQDAVAESPTPVTIGRENPDARHFPLTILRRAFYVGRDEAGTLALIGPTRLDYERSQSILDFTARAVTETLTKTLR